MKYQKSFLDKFRSMNKISESVPEFFTDEFKEFTKNVSDDFIKKHALEIIENGYTVVKKVASNDLVDSVVDQFYSWKKRNAERFVPSFYKFDDRLDRVINLHSTITDFEMIFSQNPANKITDFLFKGDTSLYTSLFFEVGSTQSPHRDIPLFWTNPAYMYFGTWLALEDVDSENGPLIVLPGSQKLPLYDRGLFLEKTGRHPNTILDMDEELWASYQKHCQDECESLGINKVEVHLEKGDFIIWHPLLVHGGKEIINKSRTRLSFVSHIVPYKTPVFHTDVFFNKDYLVPKKLSWKYHKVNGRYILNTSVSLNHVTGFDYSKLK